MAISFLGLVIVLATTVVGKVATWDGFVSFRLVVAGTALLIANARCSTQDREHLIRAVWPAFVPIITIMTIVALQIVPLPIFTNPVWDSARSALDVPLSGHISVDLTESVAAFMSLSADIATFMLTACITLNRSRAMWVLLGILGVVMFDNCFQLYVLLAQKGAEIPAPSVSLVSAASGIVIAVAGGLVSVEKAGKRGVNRTMMASLATLCVMSLASSVAIVVRAHDGAVLAATIYGLASMGAVYAVRRSAQSWLVGCAIVICLGTGAVVVNELASSRQGSGILAFVAVPEAIMEETNRMIGDTPLIGTGAGTFLIVHGLYREITDTPLLEVPSAAAAWSVELGRIMFYSLFIMCFASHVLLLRGGLQRERDFAYPAMGGGLIGVYMICTLVNAGPTDARLGILLSTALGLSFAQRLGRRLRISSAAIDIFPVTA